MADEERNSEGDIFIREVDEELKKERYAELWKAYGNYVIAAAILIVVAVGGTQAWRTYQKSEREADGEQFAQAMALSQAGRSKEALDAFTKLAKRAGAGYSTLARLQNAALLAKQGDTKSAIAVYDSLADDSSVDQVFRDLAVLLSVLQQLDTGDPAALISRLEPLTADENPWHYSALEYTAFLEEKGGDPAKAKEIFTRLGDDPNAPSGIRSRARSMLSRFGEG